MRELEEKIKFNIQYGFNLEHLEIILSSYHDITKVYPGYVKMSRNNYRDFTSNFYKRTSPLLMLEAGKIYAPHVNTSFGVVMVTPTEMEEDMLIVGPQKYILDVVEKILLE